MTMLAGLITDIKTESSGGGSTLKNNIVGFWELEEASGNRVDASGNGWDLAVGFGDDGRTAAKVGFGAVFNPAGSGMRLDTSGGASAFGIGTGDYAVCGWIKFNALTSTTFISKFTNFEWRLTFNTGTSRIEAQIFDSGVNNIGDVECTNYGTLTTGNFYYLVMNVDNTNHNLDLYVGDSSTSPILTRASITGTTFTGTSEFRLGDHDFATCVLDQVGVRKGSCFSASEISQLWNGGAGLSWAAM